MKAPAQRRVQGFFLLEMLVAVLIVSLGLFGLSKMQAAALSNTQTSRVRALIALQAASLAEAMHGNRGFWAAGGTAPSSVTVTGTTVTDASGVLSTAADCSGATCTSAQLAAYDLQTWAGRMNTRFPLYTAAIQCTTVVGQPISCVISLGWAEKYVAINRGTAAAAGATQTASASSMQYSLYVEP
ncbi:type IV pilus modification protein PilV [Variovorax sp. EL159]|uniref:type IV pilus modification protein PilV n=1 Tax=Variovorax sp. EL159 TaxID=1566270 RepID=UPI0008887632|nr:type IV pilus modification protein PilV [Variovorax sp. EL159]SCX73955.1 type IV pilus assembly protein PilV [Variovorax sp. EL159]